MKILQLDLKAYGPFTDRQLDLGKGQEGLHVVLGPNEAGKSSALRALRALLYGIPERTADNFVHDNQSLRVGGRLRRPDGSELVCYRRKGRKNTLLDSADGDPISDRELAQLLAGVDERLFEQLFGIDHQALVAGGQALLLERGHEAEALFGSGLGSTTVHVVLEQLEAKCQALFAPRASRPLINTSLSELANLQRQQREASLSARQWDNARKAVNRAKTELGNLDTQLSEANKRRTALERIRRTLPGLARRVQISEGLASLGALPILPESFSEQRENTMSRRLLAAETQKMAETRLKNLREQAAAIDFSKEILAQADTIDDLRERLGGHRKAANDRSKLAAKRDTNLERAEHRLKEIQPDMQLAALDQLRPAVGKRRRAVDLGSQREGLEVAVETAQNADAEADRELKARTDELEQQPETPNLDELQSARAEARRLGDIDQTITETATRIDRQDAQILSDIGALGLWTSGPEELSAAALPTRETIRQHVESGQTLDNDLESEREALSDAEAEIERSSESLRVLELTGDVPSEAELEEARSGRDAEWQLLRRQWIGQEDIDADAQAFGGTEGLPDAFEKAIGESDEVADRLRREAQRVHDNASAQATLEVNQRAVTQRETALEKIAAQRQENDQKWADLWSPFGIEPLSLPAMAEWMNDALRIREKISAVNEQRGLLDEQENSRLAACGRVSAALTVLKAPFSAPADGRLGPVLDQAERRFEILEKAERERAQMRKDIATLKERLTQTGRAVQSAETNLDAWQARWRQLTEELGLAQTATSGEASDYLEAIAEMAQLVDDAADLTRRIDGIDSDAARFASDAAALFEVSAPDLVERRVEEALLELDARLAKHREAKTRLDGVQEQIQTTDRELQDAETTINAADEVLDELCAQADCHKPEELQAVEERVQEHRRLTEQLEGVKRELVEGGDGHSIAELEEEAASVDHDTVDAELTELRSQIEQELQPEQARLVEIKVNAERDFAAMVGDDDAAALADERQRVIAKLRSLTERYVCLRVAGTVLRDQIERFRRDHRDPILTRASQYFKRLTCEGFTEVATDFDESDQPVLVGVRSSGEHLHVDGMSGGTRDQLYLALRLATLDHYLEGSDPLPFVVDDILIQFDDERSAATLEALADFSARTQVILFTHHQQVANQALTIKDAEDRVFVHELSRH